ncbi:MAG: rhodanese-like domain-containing protein [Bacteroidota bacterium]
MELFINRMMKLDITGKGFIINGILHLTPSEAYALCHAGAYIIDVREDYMTGYKNFDVENLLHCPKSRLEEFTNSLPDDNLLIVADATGIHSRNVAELLTDSGMKNIANLAGGIVEWERDGLPLCTNQSEKLTGSCVCQLKPREKQ